MTDKTTGIKNMENTGKRNAIRAARVIRTAKILGVSTDLVYKVLATDRENDAVEEVYHSIVDAETETDNRLLEAVKKVLPPLK